MVVSFLLVTVAAVRVSDDDLLSRVREANLRATVEKLVAFGTRMSLSNAEDPKQGIGAARNWIKTEFERLAKDSPSEITIAEQVWSDPSSRLAREGKPVAQKNVYAIVKGTTRPKEAIVFGAHYDSLNLKEK